MKKIVSLLIIGGISLFAFDGEKSYKNCAMCHGNDGKKVAMKGAFVLSSASEQELTDRLNGILDGSTEIPNNFSKLHRAKFKLSSITMENSAEMAKYILGLQ
jgi:cytochrome c553